MIWSKIAALALACCAIAEEVEMLSLDVIPYEAFSQGEPEAHKQLEKALYEKGIVGIKGVPGYVEKLGKFIEKSREFSLLSEEVKESYGRKPGEMFLGYEKGKEKFKRPDGTWVVDDLKVSFYARVPDCPHNKWPEEVELKMAFEDLGELMADTGREVMNAIGLTGPRTGIVLDENTDQLGRMLIYQKSGNTFEDNPFWCGAHFDHGLFTALTPATYFVDGEEVSEPLEAGLYVKLDGVFKKVLADPEVLLFQVGEFGQLASNDAIQATEHRVQKAKGSVERYALAVFYEAPKDTVIRSFSKLTQDLRYGGAAGDLCSYQRWNEESFKRYIVEEK